MIGSLHQAAPVSCLALALTCHAAVWRLDCASKGSTRHGFESLAGATYRDEDGARAFGFDLAAPPAVSDGVCQGERPFFVSVAATDGNYRVTLALGNRQSDSITTVKAEARRLMLRQMNTAAGRTVKESFVVNVRTASIGSRGSVRLKPREMGNLDSDRKLTLEFAGSRPSFDWITIEPVNVPTIYIAGDSTVVDQDKEPWAGWGQMLPVFFHSRVSVANQAESGETIRSFVVEHRFDKIMSTIRRGDYLFMQFAHNDQKPGKGFVPIPEYEDLLGRYISLAREEGAHPVLITSMNRRSFAPDGTIRPTLGDYPDAMREVARREQVPLVDLNRMSVKLYEAMGPQGTLKAFVHFPANTFPEQPDELKDDTHFTSYGAFELAECVVESIRRLKLPIAKDLRRGFSSFDPAHPDPFTSWSVPVDPFLSTETPYER